MSTLDEERRARIANECMMRVSKAYDLDLSSLPDPSIHVDYDTIENLETSSDVLERAAFWAFTTANRAEAQEDVYVEVAARQDGHIMLELVRGLQTKDRIIIRRETIAREYVDRHRHNQLAKMYVAALSIAIGLFTYTTVRWLFGWP